MQNTHFNAPYHRQQQSHQRAAAEKLPNYIFMIKTILMGRALILVVLSRGKLSTAEDEVD